jgi:hypothetical protein
MAIENKEMETKIVLRTSREGIIVGGSAEFESIL